MTSYVDIAPKMLLWACERSGEEPEAFESAVPKLGAWLRGEAKPTLKQLEKFASSTHTPLGYFFLDEPPRERIPIPDFRTLSDIRLNQASPNLLDTIYAMQRRQSWLREQLVEQDADPLPFIGSARLEDAPESVAGEMRRLVGLDDEWASKVRTWEDAVHELRRAIEACGVMAVINGVVGNNTHRTLDVEEFRGFALSDHYAPLLFVNGADAKSAQMFTLAHELAHLWLGEEGLSGFEGLFPGGTKVEEWCNRAAAEFLVPARQLSARWDEVKRMDSPFQALAREFKVSPIVAARRVMDLKLISREAFFSFYNEYTSRERQRAAKASGGNFYSNQNARVGANFAEYVIRAALEGRIGFKEAHDLTGLRSGTFENYAAHLGVRL